MSDHMQRIERVDEQTRKVAALLPFPTEFFADMGGTFSLQIDLGYRDDPDDPHDVAGVDPTDEYGPPVWWFDVDGGCETVLSEYTVDTDPAIVAAWITELARRFDSPAARTLAASPVDDETNQ